MYDMLVLCLAPDWKYDNDCLSENNICTRRINDFSESFERVFHSNWAILNNQIGCVYQIFPVQTPLSDFACCDDMFSFNYVPLRDCTDCIPIVRMHRNGNEQSLLSKVKILPEYLSEYADLLRNILAVSRMHSIAILCSGQSWLEEKEIIIGSVPLDSYLECLSTGEIFADVMYILRDNNGVT